MKLGTILCMITFWINQNAMSQSLNTCLISKDTLATTNHHVVFLDGQTKDGQSTIKLLFYVYKHYISSQDQQSCRFTPSCSEFAFISIKKHGLIIGVIDFFDRFARCNPLSPGNYKQDFEKQLYIDSVE